MKTVRLLLLLMLAVTAALPVAAQSPVIEIRATEDYPLNGSSGQRARALATRKAYRDAVIRLQNVPEVKSVPLKANQLDAFLPVVAAIEEEPGAPGRVQMVLLLRVPEIARRFDQLRKDSNAAAALLEVWKRSESLLDRLTQTAPEPQYRQLLSQLNANHLAAQVYASLAKTEESPASARVSSEKGRQRAWQLAEIAVATGPDSPDAHLAMGDVLLTSGLRDPAEEEYRKAVLLNPASSSAHIKLAEALRMDDKTTEAIAELREALRIDPASALAHADLGYILGSEQSSAAGISEYQQAIKLDPDMIDTRNNLGIALAREGKFPEAVAQFREILRIDPDSVLGYRNLGLALADMEKDDLAAEAFRNIVRINPNHFNAHFDLGELFRLEGKFDEAVKQFREYIRLAPDTPQNQRNMRRAREFVQTHENL